MNDKICNVSFYDETTGLFSGQRFFGPRKYLARNTPPGMGLKDGSYDHLAQRVNIETGEVVEYQPPKPNDDHEWDGEAKRWRLKAEVRKHRWRHRQALRRIDELERKQHRPHRELALNPDDSDARARLAALDAEIAELRRELQ